MLSAEEKLSVRESLACLWSMTSDPSVIKSYIQISAIDLFSFREDFPSFLVPPRVGVRDYDFFPRPPLDPEYSDLDRWYVFVTKSLDSFGPCIFYFSSSSESELNAYMKERWGSFSYFKVQLQILREANILGLIVKPFKHDFNRRMRDAWLVLHAENMVAR